MNKTGIITLLSFLLLGTTHAGIGGINEEISYGIIIGEISNVKETTLQKEDYSPMRKDKEEITFYNFRLNNHKYISKSYTGSIIPRNINIVEYTNQLGYFTGGFESDYTKPKKGDFFIFNYRFYKLAGDNFKEEERDLNIEKIYFDNGIYKEGYFNLDLSGEKISCDSQISEINEELLGYIHIPKGLSLNKEEKLNLQKEIFEKEILSQIKCDETTLHKVSSNNYIYIIGILVFISSITFFFLKKRPN